MTHKNNKDINTAAPGPYTTASRIMLSRKVTDPNVSFELPKTAMFVSPPKGHSRMLLDQQGRTLSYTTETRFTCRIVPDMIRVDPASIWDWGFNVYKFLVAQRLFIIQNIARIHASQRR
ncbi:hypothetical protein DPMN_110803 [Dreissena polymorpha]|uniref:Uncharacterized protein n=1 Tax=Dreissena polymorpha TaxID=45954 RepID=A0A9D4KDC1_DREPO|nr:hypothetical protein DPMN_110803 [Dreissena polymorpha]